MPRHLSRPGQPEVILAATTIALNAAFQLFYRMLTGSISTQWPFELLLSLALAGATLCARARPNIAILIVWVACLGHMSAKMTIQPSQIALLWIMYWIARYSSLRGLIVSGISAFIGTGLGVLYIGAELEYRDFYQPLYRQLRSSITDSTFSGSTNRALIIIFLAAIPLILPWLLGLLVRIVQDKRFDKAALNAAQEERETALRLQELAEKERTSALQLAANEAAQAKLARDVHDIVGHSLAVVYAQGQAGQFLDDKDALKDSLATITESARKSLGEIRLVLEGIRDGVEPTGPTAQISELMTTLRSSGIDARETTIGSPRPLPPEVETTIYRVVQEMVTNILKYADPQHPVEFEYVWEESLRITEKNVVLPDPTLSSAAGGQGIPGMKARLLAIGGDLTISRDNSDGHEIIEVTAWVPFSSSSGSVG